MNEENIYEKPSIWDRMREIATLAAFTAGVAVLSIIVMDILIYPLTYFAIHNSRTFTFIIKDVSFFLIILIVLSLIIRRMYLLRKEGLPAKKILSLLLYRPLYYISILMFILFLTSIMIAFLYLLLNYNYYLLYRFSL